MACLPVLASGLSLERGQPCSSVPPCGAVAEGLEGSPGWGWEGGGQATVLGGAHPERPCGKGHWSRRGYSEGVDDALRERGRTSRGQDRSFPNVALREARGGGPGRPLGAGSRDRQLGPQLLLGSRRHLLHHGTCALGTFRVSSHRVSTIPLGSGLRSLLTAGETEARMRADRPCAAQWSAAGLSCRTGVPLGGNHELCVCQGSAQPGARCVDGPRADPA